MAAAASPDPKEPSPSRSTGLEQVFQVVSGRRGRGGLLSRPKEERKEPPMPGPPSMPPPIAGVLRVPAVAALLTLAVPASRHS